MGQSKSRKQRLQAYLEEKKLAAIAPEQWFDLLHLLAPVSENYLRDLLQATGLPVAQPYGGVRQGTLEELEESLTELGIVYAAAIESGDRDLAKACRRVVMQAKDRSRAISKNVKVAEEKRIQKQEMLSWLLVWLENPPVFPAWARLRGARLSEQRRL